MSSQTHEHRPGRVHWTVLCAVLLSLTTGCQGYLEFAGQTETVTMAALPAADCPAGWTSDTVPAAVAIDLEHKLTQLFASIGDHADSELNRRNAGDTGNVRITSLSLWMTDTDDATDMQSSFGFLSSLEIYVESTKTGSSLPRVLIARSADIPQAATTLPLQVDKDLDLHPYLSEGIRISTELVGRSCLRRSISFRAAYIGLVRPEH